VSDKLLQVLILKLEKYFRKKFPETDDFDHNLWIVPF